MTVAVTYTSYWKPSLSESDTVHLKDLGFLGAVIKGNPYRRHLKKSGDETALCGAKPGASKGSRKMVDRTGWLLYEGYERPGSAPCERCLKIAEGIAKAAGQEGGAA